MKHTIIFLLIFFSPDSPPGALADPPPGSRYAGTCARRCRSNSTSIIQATLVDPIRRIRTGERVYIYSTGNPAILCRCHSTPARDRRRAERAATASLASACLDNCRAGTRLYPDVLIVEPDGREHHESISILQYDSPIGCLCTDVPVDVPPPAPPRRHPED